MPVVVSGFRGRTGVGAEVAWLRSTGSPSVDHRSHHHLRLLAPERVGAESNQE
jgi:hypothetical protein